MLRGRVCDGLNSFTNWSLAPFGPVNRSSSTSTDPAAGGDGNVVVFSSTDTRGSFSPFEVAMSGRPSLLKSATAIRNGTCVPSVANGDAGAAAKPPAPSPSSTANDWTGAEPLLFALARSRCPSPSKSAVTRYVLSAPSANGDPGAALRPPAPSPTNT